MVAIHKRRLAYLVHGTTCAYAVVVVNGARVVTASVESNDLEVLHRGVAATGMAGLEPIDHQQAITRSIGRLRVPLPHVEPGA